MIVLLKIDNRPPRSRVIRRATPIRQPARIGALLIALLCGNAYAQEQGLTSPLESVRGASLGAPEAHADKGIDSREDSEKLRPCGEHTVAVVNARGKTFFFCVFEDENGTAEGVFEYGDSEPVIESFGCAADLFATLSDEAVPEVLERSCNPDYRSTVVSNAPVAASTFPYCGAGGAREFAEHHCWETWHDYQLPSYGILLEDRCSDSPEDDLDWQCYDHDVAEGSPYAGIGYCRPYGHGWHQRTARTQLQTNAEIRFGREVVASCGGTTVFEAYFKNDSSDHWQQALDFTMYHGGVGIWYFFNPRQDYYNMRFKAKSYDGLHRYTGGFRIF